MHQRELAHQREVVFGRAPEHRQRQLEQLGDDQLVAHAAGAPEISNHTVLPLLVISTPQLHARLSSRISTRPVGEECVGLR